MQPSTRHTPSLRLLTSGVVAVLALSGAGSAALAAGPSDGSAGGRSHGANSSGPSGSDDVVALLVRGAKVRKAEPAEVGLAVVEEAADAVTKAAELPVGKAVKDAQDKVDGAGCAKESVGPAAGQGRPQTGTVGAADCHDPKGQGPKDRNGGNVCEADGTGVQDGNPANSTCGPPVVTPPVGTGPVVPVVPVITNPIVTDAVVTDPVVPAVTGPVVVDELVPTVDTAVPPAAPVAPVETGAGPADADTGGPAVTPASAATAASGSSTPSTAAQQPAPTTSTAEAPGQDLTSATTGRQPSTTAGQPSSTGVPAGTTGPPDLPTAQPSTTDTPAATGSGPGTRDTLPGDGVGVTGQPAPDSGTVEQPGEQEPGVVEGAGSPASEEPIETGSEGEVDQEDADTAVTTAVAAAGSDEGAAEATPDSLPFTGASTDQALLAGTVLLVVGLMLALSGRRRRTA